jgi:hypothetical protein
VTATIECFHICLNLECKKREWSHRIKATAILDEFRKLCPDCRKAGVEIKPKSQRRRFKLPETGTESFSILLPDGA